MPKSFLARQFDRARLKLTLLYLGMSGFIVMIFSVAAFNAQRYAVDRVVDMIEIRAPEEEKQMIISLLGQRLEEFDNAFRERLMLLNVALLIGAGVASYILSGYSLRSIRDNVESQEEFAADASHELRTPLTTISMEIVALQKTHKKLSPHVKETLQSIQQEVRRMQEIVNGLLTLVRDDDDRTSISEVTDLNPVVADATKQMQTLAKEKRVTVHFRPTKQPLSVRIDTDQIKQLCLILLDNAIKYTPSKGKVTVTTEQKGRSIILAFEDTGVGIPESDLPHIFDRFYRVQRFDKNSQKGAGLGLTIAQKLIESARATVKVSSTIGVGTRIALRFPRAS